MTNGTTTTPESRAMLAYTAYCKAVDFKDKNGRPLPSYGELPEDRRVGWVASADLIWSLATTGKATL